MGLVINAGFAQMMDAMTGWMGFDIAGDDNPDYKYGRWPWEGPRSPAKPPGEKPPGEKPADAKKTTSIDAKRIP